jgi:putative phosphoesterase
MKIGILSDSHDRVERVAAALDLFRAHGVDRLIHCGDITSPRVIERFSGWTADFVFGNCDWDPAGLSATIDAIGGRLHDPFGELEIAGRRIAWLHGHDSSLFRSLEAADHYDWLFYGHSHAHERHVTGRTHVVNPGALHRVRVPTVAILDVAANRLEFLSLEAADESSGS